MFWNEIKQSTNITMVAINLSGSQIASLDSTGINVYKIDIRGKKDKQSQHIRRIEFSDDGNNQDLRRRQRQITFLEDNSIYCLSSTFNGTTIQGYHLDSGKLFSETDLSYSVTHLFSRSDHDRLHFQSEKGMVFSCDPMESTLAEVELVQFSSPVNDLQVIHHKNKVRYATTSDCDSNVGLTL
jgi:hypothetical protein